MTSQLAVVSPIPYDWASISTLVLELSKQFVGTNIELHVLAVDDGSSEEFDLNALVLPTNSCIRDIEVLHITTNLGNQRTIAVGLTEVRERDKADLVVIMDSNGEDRPSDIVSLLTVGQEFPDHIFCASRINRSEGLVFRFGYSAYKLISVCSLAERSPSAISVWFR